MKNGYLFFLLILSANIGELFQKKITTTLLSQDKVSSENCKDITLSPNSENVKYNGRFYVKDEVTWLAFSGSAIEFYLTGKSAEVILAGESNAIYFAEDQRARYAIYIDNNKILDTTMGELEKTVKLFENEEEKEVKVRIILLSEASHGGIGVKNINVNTCSNSERVIRPSEYKKLRIEYLGDSITCAYGVECKSPSEPFQTTTENFELSYAFLSAKELDADYSGVCYSGIGVGGGQNAMPQQYTKVSYNEEWDFTKFPNDVVVINLGTNDGGYQAESKHDEYIQEYTKFLGLIREKNPNAYIICTLGMMGGEGLYPLIEKSITLFGDEKVFSFFLPNQDPEDGIGSQYHPNWVTHAKDAKIVAQKIREILGIQ